MLVCGVPIEGEIDLAFRYFSEHPHQIEPYFCTSTKPQTKATVSLYILYTDGKSC